MKVPPHRHIASRADEDMALMAQETANKIAHLEGVQREHHNLMDVLTDDMKEGETVVLHYQGRVVHLMRVPPK